MSTATSTVRAAFAGLVLAAACATPGAQTAAAPDPRRGDTWTYRRVDLYTGLEIERNSLRFLRRSGSGLEFETAGRDGRARPTSRTADLGTCHQAKDITDPGCGSVYRFPLAVGGKAGYSRLPADGGYGFSNQDCSVAAFERVVVPAGSFDAFRIECTGIWLSGRGQLDYIYQGQLLQTRWYAPSVHGEVKTVVKVGKGRGGLDTQEATELVSFENFDDAAAAAAFRPADSADLPPEFAVGTTRFSGRFRRDPVDDSITGGGRVQWANGDTYEGALLRGARDGRGRFVWASGQTYDGTWQADRPAGEGTMRFPNGDRFDGTFVAGDPHGTGTMAYAGGGRYVGEMSAGLPHGRGRHDGADGQVLQGSWLEGKAQGPGVLRFAGGDVYDGDLRDGRPEGRGRTSFASGDRYEGDFSAGLPHGRGRYVWKSGAAWDGVWKAGLRHGPGRATAADGSTAEATFAEGRASP